MLVTGSPPARRHPALQIVLAPRHRRTGPTTVAWSRIFTPGVKMRDQKM
ncbi:MAG: hypothetical protein R2713_03855 [Ilumatobacteraceae bacterium]